jgi:hypothetical protein
LYPFDPAPEDWAWDPGKEGVCAALTETFEPPAYAVSAVVDPGD